MHELALIYIASYGRQNLTVQTDECCGSAEKKPGPSVFAENVVNADTCTNANATNLKICKNSKICISCISRAKGCLNVTGEYPYFIPFSLKYI